MEKSIKYIGFYDIGEYENEKRNFSLAAKNKIDYISSAIVKAGYDVEIISPSWTGNKKGKYKKRTLRVSDGVSLTACPTFGANNKVTKLLRIAFSWLWLFLYLIFNVKKNEKVLVYHSLWLAYPVYLAKVIKRFNIILEIEEEYSVVIKQPVYFEWIEKRIIRLAEMHIYCNDLMIELYERLAKPYVVIYGIYTAENNYEIDCKNSEKINIVYAGIIDTVKAGAFNALHIAEYLTEKYQLNIIGFGNPNDIELLKNEIKKVNVNNECQTFYDGLKNGNNYIEYLKKMDVGLSTQTAHGEYLKFSFPSKILSYLSIGLRVVSSKIDCVERSQIGSLIYYYDIDTPVEISDTIKRINFNEPYDSRATLKKLDEQFTRDIKKLLEEHK
ncbi:hypothetical protein BKC07_04450 [Peribacillus simplex]|nr:hypothetical protein BKC07_04450 [Peribacillus simplex]